ncbi:MFS transporter [Loigolactobacillus backii]|uniref:Uncharacterized protein n=1 Tax=Loigolactobacillus backii TaxID=375175 RepID=A0A192H0U5_9LACO|nr:MFS transporter [Loigolactobacillus backii]ANK61903.1 hypothetical protein AYR53_03445 [Loigolactobacillus backii]ANK68903.1 hypothetical protein AYR56_01280 [Loigolactobacillus backii]PIO82423.1 MFS transporter [Loigolactobacillus backii]
MNTKITNRWLTLGLILVGANLRLPITMLPPLLTNLKQTLGLPASLAGFLTTIPLLMFALISPFAPRLSQRLGNEKVLFGFLILLAAGSYLRVIPTIWALMIGTSLIGIGIAGGNVLLPAIIKEQFPAKIAIKTTEYTVAMGLIASLGTGFSGYLANKISLMGSMAILSLVGLAGLFVWLFNLKKMPNQNTTTKLQTTTHKSVWRAGLAWWITLFFGLQSLLYYSLLTWLPTLFTSVGFSTIQAGNLATIFQISLLPLSLVVPLVSERPHGMAVVVAFVGFGFIGGACGLLAGSQSFGWSALFSLLMGASSGAAFSIAIIFFQKKTTNATDTANLSGMAQSFGYLLAATGPIAFGFLKTQLGSWLPIIWLVIALAALLTGVGVIILTQQTLFKSETLS